MATIFADSFDMYGTETDMGTANGGPWVTNVGLGTINAASTTQFLLGQCYVPINGFPIGAPFTSGTNETTIYGSVRIKDTCASSSTLYAFISFNDVATAQCTIRWNSDGSVGLYSGGPTGTLISTTSSVCTASVWNSFQFKVVIDNTAGSIELRVNGSTTDAINAASINTRGGTSNAYANRVSIGCSTSVGNVFFDDLYLNNTSGNNPITWPGDVRAIQMVPATATASNFSPSTGFTNTVAPNAGNSARTANTTNYAPWTPTRSGTVPTLTVTVNAGATANVKCALYDNTGSGGGPGTPLATANVLANPVAGANTITFASPPSVTAGTAYYVAYDQDASVTYNIGSVLSCYSGTTTYASFPVTNPASLTGPTIMNMPATVAKISLTNYSAINDLTEDGDTSYISSSTVQEDTYTLTQIATTYTVIACQYYVMWKKSDVGSRTAQLSLNANSSGDTAEITNSSLLTSYQYQFKTLEKDPTGAYWTPTTANAQVLGIAVTV